MSGVTGLVFMPDKGGEDGVSDGVSQIIEYQFAETTEFMVKELQEIVGGYIEGVYPVHGQDQPPVIGFINEEGKIKGMEFNALATMLWLRRPLTDNLPDIICGPMVVLGIAGEDDMEHDCPQWVYDFFGLVKEDQNGHKG